MTDYPLMGVVRVMSLRWPVFKFCHQSYLWNCWS